jgi:hypothetical protein
MIKYNALGEPVRVPVEINVSVRGEIREVSESDVQYWLSSLCFVYSDINPPLSPTMNHLQCICLAHCSHSVALAETRNETELLTGSVQTGGMCCLFAHHALCISAWCLFNVCIFLQHVPNWEDPLGDESPKKTTVNITENKLTAAPPSEEERPSTSYVHHMSLTSLLRTLYDILAEKIALDVAAEVEDKPYVELQQFVYERFLRLCGVHSVAENRLVLLFDSLVSYESIPLCRNIARWVP